MLIKKTVVIRGDLGLLDVKYNGQKSTAINTELSLDGNTSYYVACSIERLKELHKNLGAFLDEIE